MCNIKYDGIALGSYARKAVKDLIARDDFFDNKSVRLQALNIAENIAKELKVNML